jgi:hypothetical protein
MIQAAKSVEFTHDQRKVSGVALGTRAANGGIPAIQNSPTGAMGRPDDWAREQKSKAGLPVMCTRTGLA